MSVQVNLEALLAQAPFSQLDQAFTSYAHEALGQECDAEEAAEVLGPYLLDAGLVTSEEQVRRLVGCIGSGPAQQGPTLLAAPTSIGQLAAPEKPGQIEGDPEAAVGPTAGKGLSAARQAAKNAEEVKAALTPGAALELTVLGDEASEAVAKLFPAEMPGLVAAGQEQYLAASFVAFAEERGPSLLREWAALLREVFEDAGTTVEGEELMEVAMRVAERCVRKGLLKVRARQSCPGDVVLAVLPEDGEWHEAVVDSVAEDGVLRLIFVEYGKPLDAQEADVRHLEDVADDEDAGELQDGSCEMCQRTTKLTFHHLIPKDKHPTYMGKRLPRGIEGEPTRHFLNSYGLMICRQCHNTVHRIASNEVLATHYNTLAKIMDHPTVQRWVTYISQQRPSGGGR